MLCDSSHITAAHSSPSIGATAAVVAGGDFRSSEHLQSNERSSKGQNQPNMQAVNSGRRTTRASSAKVKKSEQTVVISSSEGRVSNEEDNSPSVSNEEDSSPSSEWNGSDDGGKFARRSRPTVRRRKENLEHNETDEEDVNTRRYRQKNVKNSTQCTPNRATGVGIHRAARRCYTCPWIEMY
jgi:hypothetical protein